MVCRTGDIEDEIHLLCHYEGYKELRSKFIRYLEMNDHSTNLEVSDSIRDSFGKFIAECYEFGRP